jgi:hypothetical protein
MPKITGLGAGIAPANNDVLVLVSNTAGTANTQKVTVNTFFSNVVADAKFANLTVTTLNGIDTANVTTADINGGTIDGTVIGGASAAAITGTTITGTVVKGTTSLQTPLIEFTDGDDAITIADGGGVTIPSLTATTADINGGTLDGSVIGGASAAAITGTTITGTVVKGTTSLQTPLIEFTDGDDAITIADGGGVTVPNLTATTADINGGTIDGAVIGGSSAAAITGAAITGTVVKGTTSLQTPLIEFTDGDDAIVIANGGGVTIADLTATTADINGGTVDAANITVGSGKTLDVSGGTLTLAADQISGDKVQGGTIASVTITALASTTVDTTNIEVTNIKALDGTAAATIAQSTGVITVPSSVLTTTDINGGTIDATNVTVGSGKTLNVSAGTLTLADNQISGDKVEGGTIASTTITSLAATTVDTTNIEVTNIKALDGTASATIAQSTGVMTIGSSVLTTTDINGGTVDGAIIGGASAAAITGTTIGGTIISGSTSVRTPLIEFTDGDDAIAIADGGLTTIAKVTAIGGTTAGTGAFTTLTGTNFSSATVAHTIQAVTADGALDLTKTVHTLDASSATCQTTLANGTIAGQVKYIIAKDVTNATDVDLATSLGAGVTYTFQAVGECIQVLWTGAAWAVISVSANPTGTNVLGTIDVA